MLKTDWSIRVLFWVFLLGGAMYEAVPAELQYSATPAASGGQPQPALNSVQVLEYAILPGGKIIIKLVFKHELTAPPAIFASYHPTARIVLDFADTASETGKDLLEVGQFGLRSLQVVEAGTRTRMVINLARPVGYETAVKGNELLITLQPEAATRSGIPGRFSGATLDAPRHSVREVGFERGENGAGRVIVELSDTTTPIDIRQQGKTLLVDFLDSALPRQMERRLDVRDFGTAVRAIESYRLGNHVRVKIELEAAGEYSAYQVSRQLVVSPR